MLHIRELFAERKVKVSDKDFAPLTVSRGGIVPQMENVAKTEDGDNRKLVRAGDFVINSRSDRKASSGISPYDGSVSLINIVLQPRNELEGPFSHYLLKSNDFVEEYYRNGRGIVADLWTTRYSEMKAISVPVPSPDEQRRIVAYLDEKTAKIDRLIQLKEREIELLNEKKQAMISKVVSGKFAVESSNAEAQSRRDGKATSMKSPPVGFRPRRSDELVDSGVDWIGQVPKGWKIDRLSHLAVFGKGLQITKEDLTPTGTAVISYGQIHSKTNSGTTLAEHLLRHVPGQIATENPGSEIYTGDIVFADTSEDLEGIGNCVLMDRDETVFAGYHTVVVRLKSAESAKYFVCLFRSNCWRDQLRRACNGVKVYSVTRGRLSGMGVLIPPLPEQREIVAYLDGATAKIDAAVAAIEKSIGLLKERRTRLVSDAVTGRIDLRKEVA